MLQQNDRHSAKKGELRRSPTISLLPVMNPFPSIRDHPQACMVRIYIPFKDKCSTGTVTRDQRRSYLRGSFRPDDITLSFIHRMSADSREVFILRQVSLQIRTAGSTNNCLIHPTTSTIIVAISISVEVDDRKIAKIIFRNKFILT